MRWVAEVRVTLRPGIADPEGQTIASALGALGFERVSEVRSGKSLRVVLDAEDADAARRDVNDMCARLLANPVMETFSFDVLPAPAAATVPEVAAPELAGRVR